ncbi:MAG: hypothetical protein WD491_14455, partial [Balneolales bacterium]
IGTDPKNIAPYLNRLFNGEWKSGGIPEKWDGKAAERIIQVLLKLDKADKNKSSSTLEKTIPF